MSEGAVDLDACPTERSRFGRCRCGPCKICGFAKHSGAQVRALHKIADYGMAEAPAFWHTASLQAAIRALIELKAVLRKVEEDEKP